MLTRFDELFEVLEDVKVVVVVVVVEEEHVAGLALPCELHRWLSVEVLARVAQIRSLMAVVGIDFGSLHSKASSHFNSLERR